MIPCTFCKLHEADTLSEHGFCTKCHFDLTDEILGQASDSKEEDPLSPNALKEAEYWGYDPFDDSEFDDEDDYRYDEWE